MSLNPESKRLALVRIAAQCGTLAMLIKNRSQKKQSPMAAEIADHGMSLFAEVLVASMDAGSIPPILRPLLGVPQRRSSTSVFACMAYRAWQNILVSVPEGGLSEVVLEYLKVLRAIRNGEETLPNNWPELVKFLTELRRVCLNEADVDISWYIDTH